MTRIARPCHATAHRTKYPQALAKPLQLDQNDVVTVAFQVVDKDTARAVSPEQTVVRFFNAQKQEISFAATSTSGTYSVEVVRRAFTPHARARPI